MAITAADLRGYVNTDEADDTFLATCVAEAVELVTKYVGTVTVPVPDVILDRAAKEVGSELYHRRQAPNGVVNFAGDLGATPIRVARDPMVGAYPILNPYLESGPFA